MRTSWTRCLIGVRLTERVEGVAARFIAPVWGIPGEVSPSPGAINVATTPLYVWYLTRRGQISGRYRLQLWLERCAEENFSPLEIGFCRGFGHDQHLANFREA